jgi:hypothetical protein
MALDIWKCDETGSLKLLRNAAQSVRRDERLTCAFR